MTSYRRHGLWCDMLDVNIGANIIIKQVNPRVDNKVVACPFLIVFWEIVHCFVVHYPQPPDPVSLYKHAANHKVTDLFVLTRRQTPSLFSFRSKLESVFDVKIRSFLSAVISAVTRCVLRFSSSNSRCGDIHDITNNILILNNLNHKIIIFFDAFYRLLFSFSMQQSTITSIQFAVQFQGASRPV